MSPCSVACPVADCHGSIFSFSRLGGPSHVACLCGFSLATVRRLIRNVLSDRNVQQRRTHFATTPERKQTVKPEQTEDSDVNNTICETHCPPQPRLPSPSESLNKFVFSDFKFSETVSSIWNTIRALVLFPPFPSMTDLLITCGTPLWTNMVIPAPARSIPGFTAVRITMSS
jgi:hypothetical protein